LRLLTAGYNPRQDDFQIYVVDYPGVAYFQPRYATIGTGADRADLVIGDSINSLKPEIRERIPRYLGVKILAAATQSARLNAGVGGTGQIVLLDEEHGYYELSRPETNLLYNSLYLEKFGKFEKDFVDKLFQSVVEEKKSAEEIILEIEEKLDSNVLYRTFFLEGLHQ
jgi:hypothetical protein